MPKLMLPAGADPAGGEVCGEGLPVAGFPPPLVPPDPLPAFPAGGVVVVVVLVVPLVVPLVVLVVLVVPVVVVVVVEFVPVFPVLPVPPVPPVPPAFAGGVAPLWVAAPDEPARLTTVVVIPTTIVNAAAAAHQRRRGLGCARIPPSPSAPRQGCVRRFPPRKGNAHTIYPSRGIGAGPRPLSCRWCALGCTARGARPSAVPCNGRCRAPGRRGRPHPRASDTRRR